MFRYLLLAYVIGSLPVAYLITRWFVRQDIREIGSRNAGTTNVTVNAGWVPGLLTLVGDMGKGYLAALVGKIPSVPVLPFVTPAFAIAGHNWPVWLGFRGGGGLATFVGGCLAVSDWSVAAAGICLWGLLYLLCRDHDRSAVLACVLAPGAVWAAHQAAYHSVQTVIFVTTSSVPILLRRLQSIKQKVRLEL